MPKAPKAPKAAKDLTCPKDNNTPPRVEASDTSDGTFDIDALFLDECLEEARGGRNIVSECPHCINLNPFCKHTDDI